ncbi:MAG: sensor histidine kinase [Bacteroidia bacterium]
MAKTSEKLGKQNDRLLNFAYIVSHNLRKHTSNITGIVNLIKYEFLTKQNQTLIDKLDFSSEALNQTVYNLNDVLNFSFNDDISTEPLNLKSEFDKAQKLFESEFEIENATLNLNDSINVEIPFNRSYLESIIYNFISNAFKYAKTNVDLVIDVRVQQTKDTIKLFVQDNGIGIDLEMYGNKIFGMYNRFHNKVSGKGIGLFITKMQIEALDGSIDVQSELNKGTTFIVTFKKQLS